MRKIILLLSLASLAFASNERVDSRSNTQAILTYTVAAASTVCTLEVSESPTYSPLVPDVDPALFTGSNSDDRNGNLGAGTTQRTAIIGTRSAEVPVGFTVKRVSRALQTDTDHYWRKTCGAEVTTGQFRTKTIPLGGSYAEMLPYDRNNPGSYALPTFNDGTPGAYVIDPQTGAKILRVSHPGEVYDSELANTSFTSTTGTGCWAATKDNALVLDAVTADCATTGSGVNPWLFLRVDDLQGPDLTASSQLWSTDARSIDYIQVPITAKGTCVSPADCTIQAALFVDGGTAPVSEIKEQVLTGTLAAYTFGTKTPIDHWGAPDGIDTAEFQARHAVVNVAVDAITVTYVSGARFSQNLKPGATVFVNGNRCTLSAVTPANGNQLTINSCAGITGVLTGVPFYSSQFVVGFRKKTNTNATSVSIDRAGLTFRTSLETGMISFNLDPQCADTITSAGGYLCMISNPFTQPWFYHINATTGVSNFLGYGGTPGAHASGTGQNEWAGNRIFAVTSTTLSSLDPKKFIAYESVSGMLLEVEITDTAFAANTIPAASGPYSIGTGPCVDTDIYTSTCGKVKIKTLTPNYPVDKTLFKQMEDFSNAYHATHPEYPAFDRVHFPTTYVAGMHGAGGAQGAYISGVNPVSQNYLGWYWAFDYGDGDPSHAGQVGGPRLIALSSGYYRGAERGGAVHSSQPVPGNLNTGWYAGSNAPGPGGTGFGGGPWLVKTVAGTTLDASSNTAVISLDPTKADYYDPTPNAAESGTPGALFKMRVGDYLECALDENGLSNYVEIFRITSFVPGVSMTLARGQFTPNGAPRKLAMGNGVVPLYFYLIPGGPGLTDGDTGPLGTFYWNFLQDPYGADETGTWNRSDPQATIGHGNLRNNVLVQYGSLDIVNSCPPIVTGNCYESRTYTGNFVNMFTMPKTFTTKNAPFAGATGIAVGNLANSHAVAPVALMPRPSLVDATPFSGVGINTTSVTGSLYKITPNTVTDGYNHTLIASQTLNRKLMPALSTAGYKPLVDISSAATGDQIDGTSTHWYHWCVASVAGECRAASAKGDVYLNMPFVNSTNAACPPNGSTNYDANGNDVTGACLGNNATFVQSVGEASIERNSFAGELTRKLTTILGRYKLTQVSSLASYITGGSYAIAQFSNSWGRTDVFAIKRPQFPDLSSANLGTFLPLKIQVGSLPASATKVLVQFWYREEEAAFGDKYCASRREACYAVAATITESNPFAWAGEMTSASGTSGIITVPVIPGRVVHYQLIYRDAGGAVVLTGPEQADIIAP